MIGSLPMMSIVLTSLSSDTDDAFLSADPQVIKKSIEIVGSCCEFW